jgi:serine/threonine protein kinase
MEFLEGEDLGVRLARLGRLDPLSTYRIAAQVARALSRAHEAGIVHRDIKPENIFLVPGDEHELAKVLDFGLAKHDTFALLDKATQTGSFLGTPHYVSPEQARGKGVDWRSDLWSLGVVVFFCLTGRRPFESDVIGELMGLILYEPIPKLSEYRPDLPKLLDAWWERAVARDPDERFQSAKEFADNLAAAIGEPALAVPSLAPHVSYQRPYEQEPPPIAAHHRQRIAKKRRALVLGTGGSALLGFLLLMMPGLSGGAPERATPSNETPFVERARETEPMAAPPEPPTATAESIQAAPTPSSQARSKTADPSAAADSKSKKRQSKKFQSASQPKPSEQFILSDRDYGI